MKTITEYKLKIIYKSGAVHEEWFEEFEYQLDAEGKINVSWTPATGIKRPVVIGVDDIAAIWQVDAREVE